MKEEAIRHVRERLQAPRIDEGFDEVLEARHALNATKPCGGSPSAGRSEPHLHVGYETGIYVLEGEVLTRWGHALENEVVSRAGDFLFVPPGIPHEAINLSTSQPARAVVARNDPAEQDKVEPYARSVGSAVPTSDR